MRLKKIMLNYLKMELNTNEFSYCNSTISDRTWKRERKSTSQISAVTIPLKIGSLLKFNEKVGQLN